MSSISVVLDNAVGWRNAVRIIGVICLAVAGLAAFIKEPKRNQTNIEEIAEELVDVDNLEALDDLVVKGEIDGAAGVVAAVSH